jgi:MFS family permease
MSPRQFKAGYFTLEGLNSIATTFYFYYLFFFMKEQYGFGNFGNLGVGALNGFIYMFAAWWGGRFAQRAGYYKALTIGFSVMGGTLAVGAFLDGPLLQIIVMSVWTVGMCFTWPTLEALVSEGETPAGLQWMVGMYNVVWASTGALAYFAGGAVLAWLGPRSLFWVPVGIHVVQLGLLALLALKARSARNQGAARTGAAGTRGHEHLGLNPRPIARARTFLKMAWIANPFAYVAINTVVAVVPGIADRLGLTPMQAGFFCSLWTFSRLGAFAWLWFWPGWQYRSGWFLGSFGLLILTFGLIVLVPSLAIIIGAQIFFGLAIGLIYYSSLFYSMDVGEAKGEHGGMHEAAIGFGIFIGPAVGAASLGLFPRAPSSGAWAVSALLVLGLAAAVAVWRKGGLGRR